MGGRQPVPHDGAEEHPGVHDGLADGAAAIHYAGRRAVSVQGEADLHDGGAAGEAVPAKSGVGVGRGVRVRSDAVAIGGDAEQSLSADAAFLAEAEAGDGVRKGVCLGLLFDVLFLDCLLEKRDHERN